mmetsp:Transcript_7521/g.11325  ORF Transcript_7521/g.11325 Transcript_7521/m.11325 type:complete len:82 (-) Transcript_7521:46-291(-)
MPSKRSRSHSNGHDPISSFQHPLEAPFIPTGRDTPMTEPIPRPTDPACLWDLAANRFETTMLDPKASFRVSDEAKMEYVRS